MRSGQATGCVTSFPIILFLSAALLLRIHLHWLVWTILIIILTQTLGLAFHGDAEEKQKDHPLFPEYNPIQGAQVDNINGHTIQIKAKGRTFLIWKNENGQPFFQEQKHGKPIGNVVTVENSWKYGKTPDQDLAEFIKIKINRGE